MSERIECEKCRRPMSLSAARCPHCSALQARAPLDPARAKRPVRAEPGAERPVLRDVSPEEARALLAIAAAREPEDDAPAGGPFDILGWMVLPDPRSYGGARATEIALTAAAIPILLASALSALMAMHRLRRAHALGAQRAWAGGIVTSGALVMMSIVHYAGASLGLAAGASIAQMLILGAREIVRSRSRRRAVPELD